MKQDSILDKPWFTGNGKQVNLIEVIKMLVRDAPVYDRIVHIGTDGQRRKKRPGVNYVTVVAIHDVGKGARGFYCKLGFPRSVSLQEKLFQEAWYSLEVALTLCEIVPKERLFIHIDANPNMKYASSRYHKQLAGMVTGQGFKVILKPDAWASSHAADNLLKSKHGW